MPRKHTKAVILDFDGTMVDSYQRLHRGMVDGMRKHSKLNKAQFQEWSREFTFDKFWKHMNWNSYAGEAHGRFGIKLSEREAVALKERIEKSREKSLYDVQFYPDVKKALEGFKKRGFTVALASYSTRERMETMLEREGMLGLVDKGLIFSKEHSPNRNARVGKLLGELSKRGITPEECVYVGDMPSDAEAGRANRVKTLIVRRKMNGRFVIPKGSFKEHKPHRFLKSKRPLLEVAKHMV